MQYQQQKISESHSDKRSRIRHILYVVCICNGNLTNNDSLLTSSVIAVPKFPEQRFKLVNRLKRRQGAFEICRREKGKAQKRHRVFSRVYSLTLKLWQSCFLRMMCTEHQFSITLIHISTDFFSVDTHSALLKGTVIVFLYKTAQ